MDMWSWGRVGVAEVYAPYMGALWWETVLIGDRSEKRQVRGAFEGHDGR